VQDLLFSPDQSRQAVEEYARYVERFAAVDRAMWDYNPRTSSIHRGYFYRSPAPYHGGAQGYVRRELTSPDFEGMVNWVQEFIGPTGYGGKLLQSHHEDPDIPHTPVISYAGSANFPVDQLRFTTSPFADPQASDSFRALQWRVAEVTDPKAPTYDPTGPIHYEITPTWQSEALTTFNESFELPPGNLKVGHAYRVRARMQDSTGRWSHWSDPIPFIPTSSTTLPQAALRISEIHYHPAPATPDEVLAGFVDADDFEFIEIVNSGREPIDLTGVRFVADTFSGGEEGIAFDFSLSPLTTLDPGQRAVVVEDEEAFRWRYGPEIRVAGEWSGGLNNADETVTLAAFGQTLVRFTYRDDWYRATDGGGPSLEAVDVLNPDTSTLSTADGWRPSPRPHGTPGQSGSIAGDANRDGVFNSADLVLVFQAAEFEDAVAGNSVWEDGDWTGDGDFTTADLVLAFQLGGYLAETRPAAVEKTLAPQAVSAVFALRRS
jgi:hypothetical protein